MGRCWGFWGKLGIWDTFRGCFAGSGRVRRRSGAAGGGPGSGRAGESAVNDDVAVVCVVLGCSTGAGWGGLGRPRGLLDRRLEFLVEQNRSVE
jgi:hypothetical protein